MERHARSNMRILSAAIAPIVRKVSDVVVHPVIAPSPELRRSKTSISITIALQLLLWCSIAASGIAVYIFTQHLTDATIVPTCVLMCVAPLVSIAYILLHCAVSKQVAKQTTLEAEEGGHATLSHSTIRLSVAVTILWLLTAGWNTIMVVRQVACPFDPTLEMIWRSQATCIAHRIGACITVLAFIDSACLFTILAQAHQPFEAHLFGGYDNEVDIFSTASPPGCPIKKRSFSTSSPTRCSNLNCVFPGRRHSQTVYMYHSTSNTNLQLHPSPAFAPSPVPTYGLGIYAPLPRSPSPPKRSSKLSANVTFTSDSSGRSASMGSKRSSTYSQCSALPPPQYPSSLHVPLHMGAPKLERRHSSFSFEKVE